MTIGEKLGAFIKQAEIDRQQDTKKSKADRFENLSFILWGFALATASIGLGAISPPLTGWKIAAAIVSIVTAIGFSILAVMAIKKRMEYGHWDWKNFWGD